MFQLIPIRIFAAFPPQFFSNVPKAPEKIATALKKQLSTGWNVDVLNDRAVITLILIKIISSFPPSRSVSIPASSFTAFYYIIYVQVKNEFFIFSSKRFKIVALFWCCCSSSSSTIIIRRCGDASQTHIRTSYEEA